MSDSLENIDHLLTQAWSPTVESRRDRVDGAAIRRLAATLDTAAPTTVPPLWHWLAFLPEEPTTRLGRDGHPPRGGFLPPIDLERRMFGGAQFIFHQSIEIDEPLERTSEVTGLSAKKGRTGNDLVVVTALHRISSARGLLVEETDNLVYLDPLEDEAPRPPAGAATNTQPRPDLVRAVKPTQALLFRFSALTFNSHRIHYDRPYATQVEAYPDLVVHGPLQALWLAEMLRVQELTAPSTFSFRAVSPAFVGDEIDLAAWRVTDGQWGLTAAVDGRPTLTAKAELPD